MNTEQIKDMQLLYSAVYNEELREQFEEYNNTIYDEDIVEVATEYFYSYGLNEDGIGILIEKVGLESFVEYVYELSEDLHVLTEERRARKRTGGDSYAEVKAKIDAKEEAKKKAKEAATEKNETERKEPESRGVESQAKAEQPKSKKPERSGIARAISGAVDRAKRDTELLKKSWNTAREVGRGHEANVARAAGTVAGAAHGAAKVAHRLGQEAGKSETGKKIKKVLFGEEVEAWVNQLVEEGYDLSEYTWDDMVEIYNEQFTLGKKKTKEELARYVAALQTLRGNNEEPTTRSQSSGEPTRRRRTTNLKDVEVREDIYDTILSHLIDEGYAESVEQAEVIMVNMSENWRESICEGPVGEFADKVASTAGSAVGTVQRAVREVPKYVDQKIKNVAGTYEYARQRADANAPSGAPSGAMKTTPRSREFSHGNQGGKPGSMKNPGPNFGRG